MIRAPGSEASHGSRWSSPTEIRTIRRPVERRTSRSDPPTTIRPRSTIATDSHSASATSIWCVEKTTVRPRSRSSRNASRRSITLTGSSPVNGSSMSITCGSWRTAAMNWTFCWLPLDSCSALRFGEVLGPEPAQPGGRLALRPPGRDPVEPREEHELLHDPHPRVQPALLGEVAPRRARQAMALGPAPRHAAGVRLEHAERDPHRRGLARAVRTEESEHLPGRDLEREVVEGDDGPEPLVEMVDDEGHSGRSIPGEGRSASRGRSSTAMR